MTTFRKLKLAVKRGVFTETSPADITLGPREAKRLRPQAIRIQKELTYRRLRDHYLTAQTCLGTTMLLWLFIPTLPSSSQIIDMPALSLSLHIAALMTMIFGLLQAWAMSRAAALIEEI